MIASGSETADARGVRDAQSRANGWSATTVEIVPPAVAASDHVESLTRAGSGNAIAKERMIVDDGSRCGCRNDGIACACEDSDCDHDCRSGRDLDRSPTALIGVEPSSARRTPWTTHSTYLGGRTPPSPRPSPGAGQARRCRP